MKKTLKTQLALTGMLLCLGTTCSLAFAEEDKPSADLTVGAYSKYVWRGYELSDDSIVIQPSMTVSYKGFSANLWGNLDTDYYVPAADETNVWNETDLTLSYAWSMGPVDMSAGYIYYALDGADDTQEAFVSAGLDTLLAPTLTVYRDYDALPGWYATLGVSHSLPLKGDVALDLGAHISYLEVDDVSTLAEVNNGIESGTEKYSGLHDGLLSASVTFPINQYVSVTPSLNYSFPLSSDASDRLEFSSVSGSDDSFLYGGIAVSLAF
jgi:hypothetical protein